MHIDIIRVSSTGEGTFGALKVDGMPLCVTLERPWQDNQRNVSCIPAGGYLCRQRHSSRFGETLEVVDVPGRSDILFHTGNVIGDSRGCIILGEKFGAINGQPAVLSSKAAMDRFREVIQTEGDILLLVQEVE